ncbi:hypothetical protein [Bradyrhizobium iriomotense]|uniref:Uncharacterized protein n=1 Tax=Bradyrhizobium iriomotense TaxID=441950 RepID=A0ABQ6BEF7_9BRAD|nr:hypothetical protein [Bradyrhizobium iriomotense]GLR90563.1 hypothetical protein GCM10007857_72780 [Bradyrhizobium iriomotense]
MKFAPPGAEPYRTLTRVDGWFGSNPNEIPNSIAREIAAALPLSGLNENDRIRSRMMARQMAYERKKKVRIAFRRRFGLLTR